MPPSSGRAYHPYRSSRRPHDRSDLAPFSETSLSLPPKDPDPTPPHAGGEPASLDRYRQIFEAVALPVLMIDANSWRVVAVNQAAIDQYGYPRDEFVGLSVLDVRPPEGREDARRVLSEMPHGFWKASAVLHRRKDGSVFSADVWSRDTAVEGKAVRIATISDVTERVELQHELQQAQKMEAVGRLAGGIAHDFNNVLTSIIGGTELLMERLERDASATHDLARIRRSAERAASLTRKLLAFSRQQVMRSEVVPLNDVVGAAEALLERLLGAHVALRTRLDPDTGLVQVDPAQLEQVVLNLAVNAQDAMPGGGTLSLATRNVTLEQATTSEGLTIPAGSYAELTVQDTGMGMDEITRARVFEPFFTTKPPPEGTGLGLSMAYGIVRQSGGFITVESAPGQGATFRVLLPRTSAPASLAASAPPPTGEEHGTVLVVEDEDPVRRITCRVLERLGFTVLSAADGEEALALVEREGRPGLDLLVTDLVMPRLNGRNLAKRLAAVYPDLRILFVSGYTDDAVGQLGMLGDGRGFLQKPFSLESLGEAVRRVLSGPAPAPPSAGTDAGR